MNAQSLDALLALNPTTDAPTLLKLASVPIYTPRTELITVTTLCNYAVWGFQKTCAFQAALTAVAAGADPNAAALARTLISIVSGPGFLATDPQVAALAQTIVALGQGTVSDQDATIALNTVSYPAGFPLPVLADCQAAIDRAAADAPFVVLQGLVDADFSAAQNAFNFAKVAFNSAVDANKTRTQEVTTIQTAGGVCPADLKTLDATGN
jgi:hypothetical protein